MSLPAAVVEICDGALSGAACSSLGSDYAAFGSVSAYAPVAAGSTTSDCALGTFYPLNQIPSGYFLFVADANGAVPTGGSCQAPSNFVFSAGAGYAPPFDVSQLDTSQVLSSFSTGFLLVGMFWALGRAVGAIMSMVRR